MLPTAFLESGLLRAREFLVKVQTDTFRLHQTLIRVIEFPMRGLGLGKLNVFAWLIVSIYLSPTAFSLDLDPIEVGAWPPFSRNTSPSIVKVRGDYAYLGSGNELQIVDVSNPEKPRGVAGFIVGGTDSANNFVISGDYAYFLASQFGLVIVDIADPTNPKFASRYVPIESEPNTAFDLFFVSLVVKGNYAFALTFGAGILVLDITDPNNPVLVSNWKGKENAQYDLLREIGDYLYVSLNFVSPFSFILDVSDPSNLGIVAEIELEELLGRTEVAFADDIGYVTTNSAGLSILDVSDPSSPQMLGVYSPMFLFGSTPDHISIVDSIAYLSYLFAPSDPRVIMVDVSEPSEPMTLAVIDTPGIATSTDAANGFLYVADNDAGLQIYDVSVPSDPQLTSTFRLDSDQAFSVVKENHLVYLADGASGIQIIDVSQPTSPLLIGTYDTPGKAVDIEKVGSHLFVADDTGGLQVIGVNDPANPELIGQFNPESGEPLFGVVIEGIEIVGDFAYLAAKTSGLLIFDISKPSEPTLLGSIDTGGWARNVAVKGGFAYVADFTGGFLVIDVSDPTNPKRLGSYLLALFLAEDVVVEGHYAYIADSQSAGALLIMDISNPENPIEVGRRSTYGKVYNVTLSGKRLYLSGGPAGIEVYDISDPVEIKKFGGILTPGGGHEMVESRGNLYVADGHKMRIIEMTIAANPQRLGSFVTGGPPQSIDFSGNLAFITNRVSGLEVVNIEDPSNPQRIGELTTVDRVLGIAISGDFAYVGDSTAGLLVIDISNPSEPLQVASLNPGGAATRIEIVGERAYVVSERATGILILDISVPASPVEIGRIPIHALDFEIRGDRMFLYFQNPFSTVLDSGIRFGVSDISDPVQPIQLSELKLHETSNIEPTAIAVLGDYVYIVGGTLLGISESRLVVVDIDFCVFMFRIGK